MRPLVLVLLGLLLVLLVLLSVQKLVKLSEVPWGSWEKEGARTKRGCDQPHRHWPPARGARTRTRTKRKRWWRTRWSKRWQRGETVGEP